MSKQDIEAVLFYSELISEVKCLAVVNIVDTHYLELIPIYISYFALVIHNVSTGIFYSFDIIGFGIMLSGDEINRKLLAD